MSDVEVYVARADLEAAGLAGVIANPYKIEVRFLGGLSETQKNAFKAAADRWAQVIVSDVPSVRVDGEVIDDIVILAQGSDIDGPGRILGQAGPTRLRPRNAGQFAFIPAKGEMQFDTADLTQMEQRGTLKDVITHEMGHVLGFGTIWAQKRLLQGAGTGNPTFRGAHAMEEYGVLKGNRAGATPVPLENTGGAGTADSHWREVIFKAELMTGFVDQAGNPMSRMTVASMRDLGYDVNMASAEPYTLPDLGAMAEAGVLLSHLDADTGVVLPKVPMELPSDSMV